MTRPILHPIATTAAAAALAAALFYYHRKRRVEGPWLLRSCTVLASTLEDGAGIAPADDCYREVDVLLGADGRIAAVGEPGTIASPSLLTPTVDGQNKLLLPGFVNSHTHSTEHLSRGLVPPTPLDLWVMRMLSSLGEAIGFFAEPTEALHLAALHCGVESLLSGCTSIMDHCYVGSTADAEACTSAYQQCGIRAFFAPMLNDDAVLFQNYIPVPHDATARNAARASELEASTVPRGFGPDGALRTARAPSDAQACKAAVSLWEAIVAAHHRPEEGVNIVIGPVTTYLCSRGMLEAAAAIRRKYSLHGHIHLLESRAQKMEACLNHDRFPYGSAVQFLHDTGFLDVPNTTTSCAHCCWLEVADMKLLAKARAVVASNPLSNLRLGSGVCQIRKCLQQGVDVALGCDGACSSDGQDMTEAIKIACIVSTLATPEYGDWLTARETLRLAYEGGAAAVGLKGKAGRIAPGQLADVTLWDLTCLSMLPQNDPASLLVLGRPQAGPASAGAALHSVFVAGRRLVAGGELLTVDLRKLRARLWQALPRRKPGSEVNNAAPPEAEYHACAECEYRAALNLDGNEASKPPSAGARTAQALAWNPLQAATRGDGSVAKDKVQ